MSRQKTFEDQQIGRREAARRQWARKTLLRKQGGLCAICGDPMNLRTNDPKSATLDHIRPISRGGLDEITNLQLAHQRCNQRKSDRWADEARADDLS